MSTSGPKQEQGTKAGSWAALLTPKNLALGAGAALAVSAAVTTVFLLRKQKGTASPTSASSQDAAHNACLFPTLVQIDDATKEVEEAFTTPYETVEAVARGIQHDLESGLKPLSESPLKMLPTFVDKVLVTHAGKTVIALDMGGTNLRVMRVRINPGGSAETLSTSKHTIPQQFMIGSGEQLFDFIAQCVVEELGSEENVPLGFTFSFPTKQLAINHGTLVEWTKGFTASDVEGRDVAELLNSSFKRMGKSMKVTALVNDTVGTMLTGAYASQNENTLIGVIIGTGSNAAYLERADKITKWDGPKIETGQMVINMEWGNYDSPVYTTLPKTKYDVELDEASLNPKKQHYEKMLSGMYLGEIARLVLQSYVAENNLFGGQISASISTPYKFGTHFMSQIEADHTPDLSGVANVLSSIDITHSTLPVRRFVKTVCHLVALRSARLAAAGIASIVRHLDRANQAVNVAVDGSVFELYPGYRENMRAALTELGLSQVSLQLAKDGSGLGAAITAILMS